jgi:sugar/nucleoside kinase (ribokinase family)
MTNTFPILCIGQLVADVVVRPVDGLPALGRTDRVEELHLLSGGCAANSAAVLAKLGGQVRLAAAIGRDAWGDAVMGDLRTTGVDVEAVTRLASVPTSAVVVLINDSGERSFIYREGGNEQLENRHVADAVLKSCRLIHVGGAMKLLKLDLAELLGRAKSFGCTTTLDTDWDVHGNWMSKLRDSLPKIDYLMTNEDEAAMLTGKTDPLQAAEDLLLRGPRAVIVKRGAEGALLAADGRITAFPAYRVAVRDTTAAGDAFAAGFLLGISLGRPLADAVRLAGAAGALCTTQLSHRGITSLEDVRRLMAEQEN